MLTPTDLVEHLVSLGMERAEAAAYVQLALLGEADAREVAKRLSIASGEAVQSLDALVGRGYATLVEATVYRAVAPELVTARLRGEPEATTRPSPVSTKLGATGQRLDVLTGRAEFYGAMARMIRAARSHIRVVTTHPSAMTLSEASGIYDLGFSRIREGVHATVAMRTTRDSRAKLAPLARFPHVQIRHVEIEQTIRSVVVDDKEALVTVLSDPSSRLVTTEEFSIWSDGRDFVEIQIALAEALWRSGQDVRELIENDRFAG